VALSHKAAGWRSDPRRRGAAGSRAGFVAL